MKLVRACLDCAVDNSVSSSVFRGKRARLHFKFLNRIHRRRKLDPRIKLFLVSDAVEEKLGFSSVATAYGNGGETRFSAGSSGLRRCGQGSQLGKISAIQRKAHNGLI